MRHFIAVGLVLLVTAGLVPAEARGSDEDPEAATLEAWPRTYVGAGGERLVIHQPQVDRWANEALEARIAVALHMPGASEPIYGALWVSGETRTNLDTRTVTVARIRVSETRFPSTGEQSEAEVLRALEVLFPKGPVDISLDRLLANIERTRAQSGVHTTEQGPARVRIIVSRVPARLVVIDGEPVLHPINGTGLMYVVNTAWRLLLDPASSLYYLALGDGWMTTRDLLTGRWVRASGPPPNLARIPDDHACGAAKATPARGSASAPTLYVRPEPAELVVIDGTVRLVPIAGTSLLYVVNTESDLFYRTGESAYYLTVGGRWYRSARLDGPWAELDAEPPDDFARIPPDHPRAAVRTFVAGTPEAEEAVLLTQIPKKTVVRRAKAVVSVHYYGLPRFRRIRGLAISYAVNSPYDVLRVGARYYCCHQGVWFVAEAGLGPWVVCDRVPAVIYTIPPSCPLYRVTFVYVYDRTPDLVVVGYLPGYLGVYVSHRRRSIVFGTRWWYPGFVSAGAYVAWPFTFGLGLAYHTYLGGFVVGAAYYTPFVTRPLRATVYPFTAAYDRRYGVTNAYARWGRHVIPDYERWRRRHHVTGARGVIKGFARPTAPSRRTRVTAPSATRAPDNVYVGRDGNVYRRAGTSWQRLQGRTWQPLRSPSRARTTPARPSRPVVDAPTRRPGASSFGRGLDRDAWARAEGQRRSSQYDAWRRSRTIRPPSRVTPPRSSRPPATRTPTRPAPPRAGSGGGTRGVRGGRR